MSSLKNESELKPEKIKHISLAAMNEEAAGWERDQQESLSKSESRAWKITWCLLAFSALCVFAVAIQTPLHEKVPIVFTVDRNTGVAQMVDPSGIKSEVLSEAMDKHWAQEYVIHRERYEWTLLQFDYDWVLNTSSDSVGRSFALVYDGDNSRSKRLGADSSQRIFIKSVTLPPDSPGQAVVRFERITRQNGIDKPVETFVATLSYVYEQPKTFVKEKKVIDNPFGFKVTGYAVSADYGSGAPQ